MLEDIKLKDFPKSSGVYWIKDVDDVIIYVGSSKDLYMRMKNHRVCIKKGSDQGYKEDLYRFLQNNQFTVEFQLSNNYRQLEQDLVEKYNPKFNSQRAYIGCGSRKGRVKEYSKERYQKYKEEILKQEKQYRESHREEKKQYLKQYNNQVCNYSGETLTLTALSMRFKKAGIPHPVLEAKKYLIS